MRPKVEIEGDSEEAVALVLLQMVAEAEGKLDGAGVLRDVDRAWILDAYTECLAAAYGVRGEDDDEEDDEEDDDDEEDAEDEDADEDDPAGDGPGRAGTDPAPR